MLTRSLWRPALGTTISSGNRTYNDNQVEAKTKQTKVTLYIEHSLKARKTDKDERG